MWRYRNGCRTMSAEALIKFINHFRAKGDHDFASEVLGDAAPREIIYYWATDKGELHRVSDLAVWAAEARGLAGVAGDHSAAVRRNLGWVSLAFSGREVQIEYHERGINARAVEILIPFLRGQSAVSRNVALSSGGTAGIPPELPRDAIRALEAAAVSRRLAPALPWSVERLGTDCLRHTSAIDLARLASSASGSVAPLDRLTRFTVFRVDGEEVITLQVGTDSPLPQATKIELIGRPVLARGDLPYGLMVQARVLDALKNGPRYDRIAGIIDGKPSKWFGLTAPLGKGLVATHTDRDAA